MIGAGSGLAPFRGFWQHLVIDSDCRENGGVVDRVSFYEAASAIAATHATPATPAVQPKSTQMQIGVESPFLLRRARSQFSKLRQLGVRNRTVDNSDSKLSEFDCQFRSDSKTND